MNERIIVISPDTILTQLCAKNLSLDTYAVTCITETYNDIFTQDSHDIVLIIIDYFLHATDGIALSEKIRSHNSFVSLPIIVVTSIQITSEMSKKFTQLKLHHIHKPIRPVFLRKKVGEVLYGHFQELDHLV